jgi:hypothetical protein
VLGSDTGQLHAATEHKRTMIDITADWSVIYPPFPERGT